MASERDKIKGTISDPEAKDPELKDALSAAENYHFQLAREANRHVETMAAQERGWLGFLLGGTSHAPTFIAFLAVCAGLGIGVWCLLQAKPDGVSGGSAMVAAEYWAKHAERAFAFAGAAMSFIFGRTLK